MTTPSLPLEAPFVRTQREVAVPLAPALSRREAGLRAAATTGLAGIALALAIDLPFLRAQGGQFAVLSLVTMALCVGVGLALATTPAHASRQLWRVVAGTAVVVLAGWVAPRLVVIPGLAHHKGHWTGMPGMLCGALAAFCLGVAAVAAPPTRASIRGLLTAFGVLAALTPGIGAFLVALGPGLSGGESALAAGVHVHSHGLDETLIRFQAIAGGKGGHFVYRAPAPPHQTVFALVLMAGAALFFLYGTLGHLRRASAADPETA